MSQKRLIAIEKRLIEIEKDKISDKEQRREIDKLLQEVCELDGDNAEEFFKARKKRIPFYTKEKKDA